jgi:hypothetical protein
MERCQPLNVKTVVVPKGQNQYGKDVIRFTTDYCASDLFDMCIGCYPPCQTNLKGVVVISDDHSTYYPDERDSYSSDARHDLDLRKATSGVCGNRNPVTKKESEPFKPVTPINVPAVQRNCWEV